MHRIFILWLALALTVFAGTKVGGTGSVKVGGTGATKVQEVPGGPAIITNWKNKTSSGASLAVTVSIASGKDVVVLVFAGAASYTITDNLGSTYTAIPTSSGFGQLVGASFLDNAGGTITSITVTPDATTAIQIFVYECSNLSAYTTGERGATTFVGATAWASTNATTATANSILFHIAAAYTGNNSTTFSGWTNSFASYGTNSWYGTGASDGATDVSYRIVSSTGTYSSTVTSSLSGNGTSLIFAVH